jgi:CRP-like cAMP-binding protein
MKPSDNPLMLVVRKINARTPLSSEDEKAILQLPCERRTFEPSSYLVREGERPVHCGALISGFAFRHKLTAQGARQIVAIHMPGDPLDLQHLFLDVADHNVQTLTRAEMALVPRAELQRIARERPAVGVAFMVNMLVDSSIFREWVTNVGRRDARTRLAHLICEFAVRMDRQQLMEEYGCELPMTQEQLADSTGLTSVHVNRTLKGLEAEGLIVRERRSVRFPHWERLKEAADFTERYLHLAPQQSADR